jgi:hypothetical protein
MYPLTPPTRCQLQFFRQLAAACEFDITPVYQNLQINSLGDDQNAFVSDDFKAPIGGGDTILPEKERISERSGTLRTN